MTWTYRPNAFRRFGDAVFKALLSRGLGPPFMALVTVAGRRTGRPHSVPVRTIDDDGVRYLVAPYGEVNWVLNARAAGEVHLHQRGRSGTYRVVECDPEESGRVLKKYLRVAPVVRPYFEAGFSDPPERFAAEADRHPVFRVVESGSPPA